MTLIEALRGAVEAMEAMEHVRLPGMSFSRCPACLSPRDLSQPHEESCKLDAALTNLRSWEPLSGDRELLNEAQRAYDMEWRPTGTLERPIRNVLRSLDARIREAVGVERTAKGDTKR